MSTTEETNSTMSVGESAKAVLEQFSGEDGKDLNPSDLDLVVRKLTPSLTEKDQRYMEAREYLKTTKGVLSRWVKLSNRIMKENITDQIVSSRQLAMCLFKLSEWDDLMFLIWEEEGVIEYLLELIQEKSYQGRWVPTATIWNISANPRGAMAVMLRQGVPILLERLLNDPEIEHQVVGSLSALTYTEAVRDLIAQYLRAEIKTIEKFIYSIKADPFRNGQAFQSASTCSFLMLSEENIPILKNLGALQKISDFCDQEHDFGNPGFEINQLELRAFEQLWLTKFESVKKFLAFFFARYSVERSTVNPLFNVVIPKMKVRSIPMIRALSRNRNTRTSELAIIALKNLGDTSPTSIQELIEEIGVSNPKSISKKLASENLDLPLLLDPSTDMNEIVSTLNSFDFKRGDTLRLTTAIRELRALHEKDIDKAKEMALSFQDKNPTKTSSRISIIKNESSSSNPSSNEENALVFISYSWSNKEMVKKLKSIIESEGIKCWMDEGVMQGGDQLFGEIDKGVSNSKVFIACVSNSYGISENCRREILLASHRKKLIVPVIVSTTDPYPPRGDMGPLLAGKLYIDLSDQENFDITVSQLVQALKHSI